MLFRSNKYQQKLERLTHENKKLKQSPLFVATVQELTSEGVIIKQHGNNQEALTEVTDEMRTDLEPDDRVAVNNSLSIVKQLDDETDVRARVMQVDQSPDVTYEDIGGIDAQMEEVRETVEMPIQNPEMLGRLASTRPRASCCTDRLAPGRRYWRRQSPTRPTPPSSRWPARS